MANTSQKVPLARTLNNFAVEKALDVIQQQGKALPASVTAVNGSIVTVKFEIQSSTVTLPPVTIPKVESAWLRAPTQVGDYGLVIPSDVSLGAISGLGGASAATLSLVPNLSALAWVPIASKNFAASPDPNAAFINGPDGVILQDTAGNVVAKISHSGSTFTVTIGTLILSVGSTGVTVDGTLVVNGDLQISGLIHAVGGTVYTGNIQTAGDIIAGFGTGDQVGVQTHTHTQPNDSHNDTEAPTSSPTPGT